LYREDLGWVWTYTESRNFLYSEQYGWFYTMRYNDRNLLYYYDRRYWLYAYDLWWKKWHPMIHSKQINACFATIWFLPRFIYKIARFSCSFFCLILCHQITLKLRSTMAIQIVYFFVEIMYNSNSNKGNSNSCYTSRYNTHKMHIDMI
jgi:hypothetical protein